ncbi:MAG: hypothetical protein QM527_11205 [Alphaproteobacteria bacterium]|nr:hypothetical protein [Alphaproteobacteria bacterium]
MDANETLWVHRPVRLDFAAEASPPPKWLKKARAQGHWRHPEHAMGTAFEAALCALAGLIYHDGLFPWAAWGARQAGLSGQGWAEIHLCHWHVSNGQVILMPAQCPSKTESDQLWSELADFVAGDGLTLIPQGPDRAWVHGLGLREVATASYDKVMGRPVANFLPDSSVLRRLQSELQMWFYNHPLLQSMKQPVNSVWFSGTGSLDPALVGVLERLRWLGPEDPPAQAWVLLTHDEHASLWRTEAASLWQQWMRRWRPVDPGGNDRGLD